MDIQEMLLYVAILIPLVLIPVFGYKKNPIYFVIGIQLSFYLAYGFYERYLDFNLYDFNEAFSDTIRTKAMEEHRDIIVANIFRSHYITFLYVMTIAIVFWYIKKNKNANRQQSLKIFMKSSLFYILLFLGATLNMIIGFSTSYCNYWNPSVAPIILVIPFLIKAITLRYPTPIENRNKTSKITWFILILCIVFYFYISFMS